MTSSQAAAASSGEEILVLYGSQTGNSESAAQEIASLVPSKLPPGVTARCMHLDDLLEVERGNWTRLAVIVCSSYGVGQAPIGARKFREWCDAVLEKSDDDKFLSGVTFALLGLGDSHYTTFFRNPTVIDEALSKAGAVRVGELGKADASGTGTMEQGKVVERWIDGIWKELRGALESGHPVKASTLEAAREKTWDICLEIFPEWKPKESNGLVKLVAAVLLLVMGAVVFSGLVDTFLDRKSLDQEF